MTFTEMYINTLARKISDEELSHSSDLEIISKQSDLIQSLFIELDLTKQELAQQKEMQLNREVELLKKIQLLQEKLSQ